MEKMRVLLLFIFIILFNRISPGQSTQLTGGNNFSVGLCGSGYVYTWGSNSSGQIGAISAGTPYPATSYSTPQPVYFPPGVTFTQVNAGSGATALALTCKGTVYAWGENKCGQVGKGSLFDCIGWNLWWKWFCGWFPCQSDSKSGG